MAILMMDQHDKWGQYHLWLHVGIDPFTGYIAWLKIWRTNHNPRLIAKYYLDAIRELGGALRLVHWVLRLEQLEIRGTSHHTKR